jgi:GNAT superfamily N-acetyltransferase
MNTMYVRKAVYGDDEILVSFQLNMAIETEGITLHRPTVEKGLSAVLNDPAKGNYYVALYNDQIIGSLLTTFEWSDWRNGTVLWIQSVYVIPEFRRKGVYSKMYEYLKEMVLFNEYLKGIRLYADKNNVTAHHTYKKLGMSPDHYVTFEWLK